MENRGQGIEGVQKDGRGCKIFRHCTSMLSMSLSFWLPWIQAFATSSRIDLAPFCVGGGEDSWLSVLQFLWQLDIP
ncbi:hypothetical protein WN943_027325 [Citrus x changshan-huyou]